MDKGERPWETAVRECREETGLTVSGPPRLLATVYGLPAPSGRTARSAWSSTAGVSPRLRSAASPSIRRSTTKSVSCPWPGGRP
ncbi:NUDIX hydrolase [Streptomyces cuspidosporus]